MYPPPPRPTNLTTRKYKNPLVIFELIGQTIFEVIRCKNVADSYRSENGLNMFQSVYKNDNEITAPHNCEVKKKGKRETRHWKGPLGESRDIIPP